MQAFVGKLTSEQGLERAEKAVQMSLGIIFKQRVHTVQRLGQEVHLRNSKEPELLKQNKQRGENRR